MEHHGLPGIRSTAVAGEPYDHEIVARHSMMKPTSLAVLALGAVVGAVPVVGCHGQEDCGACPGPEAYLYVRDAVTMMAIEGVTVTVGDNDEEQTCTVEGERTVCGPFGHEGVVEVVVQAPGHRSQMLSITLGSAYPEDGCYCNEIEEYRDVVLEPE
jgi:hypothetical protein